MISLYQTLQVPRNASREKIQRNYKLLVHKYRSESREEDIIKLNFAIKILSDPYQRSFYDLFGEQGFFILNNPTYSYTYPRIITLQNIILCYLYFASIVINSTAWLFLYKLFPMYIFANILYIISPVFLLIICFNIAFLFRKQISSFITFYYVCLQLFICSLEILIISITLDKMIPALIGGISLACFEIGQLIIFIARNRQTLRNNTNQLLFRIIKGGALLLYFIPAFNFKIFIPSIISIAFGLLILYTKFIVEFHGVIIPLTIYIYNFSSSSHMLRLLIFMNVTYIIILIRVPYFLRKHLKTEAFFISPVALLPPP